ncbi:hypothetical protein MGYG_03657 [Nannizzia gypsea CBS 118893]|uniref:Uncharacterized protein n=1 Tax=Arthroderma gypseum (strain ATCC MYA-4604 / CBS 118893) TaxID=535722 RepID=E4UT37_ARTGP|nr:hypothetical protein MGYG_03657 [Nannizzia gypsea CBS 118893]EFR00650.1 hypothetical protein MGYG_03657 [Nannizzia gypsea CBS 118893]
MFLENFKIKAPMHDWVHQPRVKDKATPKSLTQVIARIADKEEHDVLLNVEKPNTYVWEEALKDDVGEKASAEALDMLLLTTKVPIYGINSIENDTDEELIDEAQIISLVTPFPYGSSSERLAVCCFYTRFI